MENKDNMETLVSVLRKVENDGFTAQFMINGGTLRSQSSGMEFLPTQIAVKHFYRFEGESSQDDEAILYAIETDSGEKGTLIDGYGASGDTEVAAFIRKVREIQK